VHVIIVSALPNLDLQFFCFGNPAVISDMIYKPSSLHVRFFSCFSWMDSVLRRISLCFFIWANN